MKKVFLSVSAELASIVMCYLFFYTIIGLYFRPVIYWDQFFQYLIYAPLFVVFFKAIFLYYLFLFLFLKYIYVGKLYLKMLIIFFLGALSVFGFSVLEAVRLSDSVSDFFYEFGREGVFSNFFSPYGVFSRQVYTGIFSAPLSYWLYVKFYKFFHEK